MNGWIRRCASTAGSRAAGRDQASPLLDPLAAAHVGTEHVRDRDGAVGVLVELEDRDQHARAGDGGVVEGVAELRAAFPAAGRAGAVAEVKATGLEVLQRAA